MHRAFTFPMTVERSRTKECLEASLAGLCELELRKQRQESLVIGALALGDPLPRDPGTTGKEPCFSIWGQENLTLRRQLSALQSHPWGLLQTLEQQVGELRIDTDNGGDGCDSRPSSGFYESSDGHSPKGRSSAEPPETLSNWAYNDRPKSVGDLLSPNGDVQVDAPILRTTLPRSYSAPYPPLEGIAEEGTEPESWFWEPSKPTQTWQHQQQQPVEPMVSEEDYQQALRVEGYILSVIQRHTLSSRPCQPRTTLNPDPIYSSLHRRTPSLTSEHHLPDPYLQPQVDLLAAHPWGHSRGCDPSEGEACGGEAPSLEEDCFLALPYPPSRPHSLVGRLPSPLPSLDPNCGVGALDLCCELTSPQHYLHSTQSTIHHNLVSAQFIPGQACCAPVHSPRHYNPEKPSQAITSPEHQKSKTSKKTHNERQKVKKSNGKNRSQSENSLLGQRLLPERRYSTTERPLGRGDSTFNQTQGPVAYMGCNNANRRWCSNLELSQDEGEAHTPQANRRQPRRPRNGHSSQHQNYQQQQHRQQWQHCDIQERAPLCQEEEAYPRPAPAESESSMSEVYSPGSSSLSSDSDESGGLVWPQQLPPRLAMTTASSSASPSPQPTANASGSQPKAFVKIKASHALKKKILRFRSGSLKVMTTV